jgi:hypothetical protein
MAEREWRISQGAGATGKSMGNGDTNTRSSVRSDVSEDTSQLAQDGGESSRLPRAPQLVMVSQGAGPVAIEIQPSQPPAAPIVRQPQVAPTVQNAPAAPTVRQPQIAPAAQHAPAAPTVRQPQMPPAAQHAPAAPAVQHAPANPNIRQSQVAPEVRQSVQQPPPPPTVQQLQASANVRQSQVAPEMRQSRATSSAQLAWIASDVPASQASPAVGHSRPGTPDLEAETIRPVTIRDIGHDSGRARTGLGPKLFGAAAVVACGVVAVWALGSVVFPNAPKDAGRDQNLSILSPAPEDASAQREQAPSDNPQLAGDNSQPADDPQSPAASMPAPATQTEQATFVAANPAAQPQPQSDQQQPQLQALNEQPQPQSRQNEPTASPQQVGNEQAQSPQPQQKSEISLSPQEVDRLTNLGEKMLAQGDVSTARRLLEHAAQARGARAALLLGATYDPEGLRKMGVLGMRPDLEKAHMWYSRAAEYGSSEASRRLAGNGQRGH